MKRLRASLGVMAVCALGIAWSGCGGGGSTDLTSGRRPSALAVRVVPPQSRPLNVSLAFPTWDRSIKAILEAAVQPQDYIVRTIAEADPLLASRVTYGHVFEEPNDSSQGSPEPPRSVQAALQRCPAGRVVIYNIEHWQFTPQDQQLDPAGSALSAASQTRAASPCAASGYPAYVAGFAPDGAFEGWADCKYNPHSNGAFYNETVSGRQHHAPIGGTTWVDSGPGNDWLALDLYDLQAQTMLSQNPSNLCYGSIATWWFTVSDRIAHAKAGNPGVQIWAELSLRDEGPQRVVDAITYAEQKKAGGAAGPDVYWLSYPIRSPQPPLCPDPNVPPTPPPHSVPLCFFVSPNNLEAELAALGRPTP